MIVVIVAGGSGTRLWPLSTPDFPKHLLTLSGESSLLQETYHRAKRLSESVYVIPEAGHVHHVREQLPDLTDDNFITEPARRGTANCIIAGLHHIQSRHDHDEPIAFIHADHLIRDTEGFVYSFESAGKASKQHQRITLVGVEPTKPATGLGYIQKAGKVSNGSLVYEVGGFKEKPAFDLAQEYVQSGRYLWNCGYFVGSVGTFIRAFEKFSPKLKENYDQLVTTADTAGYEETYLGFESDAIDYAHMELNSELLVVPANFDWMDVGSFTDVHTAVGADNAGNHLQSQHLATVDVENTLVINQEDHKQIGIVGLDNVAVINTPHALLIVRKDLDQKVKDVVAQLTD